MVLPLFARIQSNFVGLCNHQVVTIFVKLNVRNAVLLSVGWKHDFDLSEAFSHVVHFDHVGTFPCSCKLVAFLAEANFVENSSLDIVVRNRSKHFLRSNVPNTHRPIFVPSRHQQTVRMELHRMNFRVALDFANWLSLLQIKEAPIFILAADREVIVKRLK